MKTVSPSVNFPQIEQRVLGFWKTNNTFKKSLELRRDSPQYLFYDGPPFATGLPHYGHLLAGTIKDIIPRYQTMKGKYVERRFGWDTHGLPIEMLTEKECGLKGRLDILKFGIDKFNEACRAGVLRYVKEWEQTTNRFGRWIDFQNDYKTMDPDFMESVWWVFKQLWDAGRIYESSRVMPYSWRLSTTLSQSEASANYKDVQDPAITVRFRLKEKPGVTLLVWTTTPWTLPSNMAVCLGSEIEYSHIKDKNNEQLILATARLEAYFPSADQYELMGKMKGAELVGLHYEPLFDFYLDKQSQGAFVLVVDEYVSTEDGTGAVHQSPAHGEDDHRVAKLNKIPIVDPVDLDGNFQQPVDQFLGMNVKEADKHIIRALKERGLLFKQDVIMHSYPFCERSHTPLIYKAIPSWYVKVEDIREQMLNNNQTIHWIPEHIKAGRFGNWLKDARDWNISRNRFWGTPLPIWKCGSCKRYECIGDRAELEQKSGSKVSDLHRHFVDQLSWKCTSCQGTMQRIPEVLDCWFESGSMPYAQLHYPFENKQRFEKVFPADFIAEGLDQTRGWFYTLMILSTTLFKKAPFKNVIVNGMILAEDGKKMSKSLKNYPDPSAVFENHGADALRLYLISSAAVRGEALRFSETGVKEIVRTVLLPFWNVYSFFTTYANVDGYKPSRKLTDSQNSLDKWIISRLQTMLKSIEQEIREYRLYAVIPCLLDFLEDLTNWYVRRSRRRFWSEDKADKQSGYDTLYFVLLNFSRALAPFLPFITEEIFQNLSTLSADLPESVHLTDYPIASTELIDQGLEESFSLIKQTVGLGRALRVSSDLPIRQPLRSITVVTRNMRASEILKNFGAHIKEELNVKEVLFSADESNLVEVLVKPNFPVLGPRFGKQMGAVSKFLASLSPESLAALERGESIELLGQNIDLSCLTIQRKARQAVKIETANGVTVFYDTQLDTDLIDEGRAREFVNRVQRMRKEADYHVSDRIQLFFKSSSGLNDSLMKFADYIKGETLALSFECTVATPNQGDLVQEHEIGGEVVHISVLRTQNPTV